MCRESHHSCEFISSPLVNFGHPEWKFNMVNLLKIVDKYVRSDDLKSKFVLFVPASSNKDHVIFTFHLQ